MLIDRYVVREVALPFAVTVLLLLAVFTAFSLGRYLVEANAGLLRIPEVAKLTALKALIAFEVLVPLSFYFAVLIGLGRLHSDSEIYAMRSGGISERRLLRPIMVMALFIALAVGAFSVFVRPWAYVATYAIKAEAVASADVERIKPAQFFVFEKENRTVFIERFSNDGRYMHGVFIRTRTRDALQIITARLGEMRDLDEADRHRIVLQDAQIHQKSDDGPDFQARIGRLEVWMPARIANSPHDTPEATRTSLLLGSAMHPDRAEFQWRLSTPVSTLLLALLAMPLSNSQPRGGRYARLLLALVVYAVYFSLLDMGRNWVKLGEAANIWWVPAMLTMAVLALYFPWRKFRHTRRLRKHFS